MAERNSAGFATSADSSDFLAVRYNSDGTLDTGFSTDGYRKNDFGGIDVATDVITQSNGRILVSGYSGSDFALTRLNANGTIDTAFTGDATGQVVTDFGGDDPSYGMARTSDGRIVLAGESDDEFAISRYLGAVSTLSPSSIIGSVNSF